MKKQFLWLALGASALTACTSTDVVEEGPQSNAICFENVINKPTRAVEGDLSNTNFDMFMVYAYYIKQSELGTQVPVFGVSKDGVVTEGVTVTKTSNGWVYSPERYWMPEATYYFYAYSCADIALTTEKGKPIINLTGNAETSNLRIEDYICDSNHQHDLIADAAENIVGKSNKNSPVKFTFKHALCKVSAEIVNDLPAGYDIYISDAKIVNFYDKCTLNIHGNTLAWGTPYRTYGVNAEKEIVLPLNKDSSDKATSTLGPDGVNASRVDFDPIFLIPANYDNANLKLTFTVTVKYGNDVVLTRPLIGSWAPTWEPGKVYNYIVHLTGNSTQLEPIVFEATQSINDITNPDGWSGEINTDMSFSTGSTI